MAQLVALVVVDLSMVLEPVEAHRTLHILDGLPLQMPALILLEWAAAAAAERVQPSVVHHPMVQLESRYLGTALAEVAEVGRAETTLPRSLSVVVHRELVDLTSVPADHVMEVRILAVAVAAVELVEVELLSSNTFQCAIKELSQ
jgi:hypothetical protein